MGTTNEASADGNGDGAAGALRRALVLLGAFAQVAASWWVQTTNADAFSRMPPGGDPPFIPATYAFAIWGPIFLACIAYAIYQTLPFTRVRRAVSRTTVPAIVAFAGTTAWVFVARDLSNVWLNVVILAVTAASLLVAVRRVDQERTTPPTRDTFRDRWFVRAPLSLFLGWTSMATFANIAQALRESDITQPGAETVPTLLLIAAATATAVAIVRAVRGSGGYALAVLWAVVAIVYANVVGVRREPNLTVAIAAGAAAVLVAAVTLYTRRASRPAPASVTAR